MKFTGEFSVPARRDIVFARLTDAKFFASCIDGLEDLQEIDPVHYKAFLVTRIAYIKFKFEITVEFVERVAPEKVVARAEGRPLGIVGRLTSTAAATLAEAGDDTSVAYEIEVALTGKLGAIGQPVLKSKAKEMERSFVKNLNAAFAQPATSGADA